jgi:diacylglycerol kinase (ATP)
MRVVLLYNPRSGRGRSADIAARLVSQLTAAGADVHPFELGFALDLAAVSRRARGATAIVVAGGDGSVHHAAPIAIESGVPLYHFPLGTENLFSREFGSTSDPDRLLAALRHPRVIEADTASCNGRGFLLMASVGFDAHVVERVAAARTAGIRRTDYLRHAAREFLDMRLPPLTITADGRTLVQDEPGIVVTANSRQYAARLDPCTDARVDDGLLDVLFLPYRSRPRLASWAISIALGMHVHAPEARRARAVSIEVRSSTIAVPHQLDGESVAPASGPLNLTLRVEKPRLRVLVPPM